MTAPSASGAPSLAAVAPLPPLPRRALLPRITRGEVLSLLAIGVFAELLTVGWIGMVLDVRDGAASWAQALGLAGVDFLSLLWLPVPLFAGFDALPLEGPRKGRHGAARALLVLGVLVASAVVSDLAARYGGRLLGLPSDTMAQLLPGYPEQFFWSSCAVAGVSLAYLVLHRLHRARDLEQRNADLQRLAVSAQLAALSAELRPHFLFNAINNLAELVHHDPVRTESMLLHLSSLLRATLSAGQHQMVPLADELRHITDYLALQQMRFGDRLVVTQTIDAAVQQTPVPPMLLQPLVENGIVHGIEGRAGASMLSIRATAVADAVEIVIDDDGPGPQGSRHTGTGTGLRNVRGRLAALYGESASLALTARPGGGMRTTLRVPRTAA